MDTTHTSPGYYSKWAAARSKVRDIVNHLSDGGIVVVATYTKATQFDDRHVQYFKAAPSGAFMRRGKGWVCFDGASVKFYRTEPA